MLIRPAIRYGLGLCTILSVLTFVSPSAKAAETAQSALKKMLALYTQATSFQGTLKINSSGTTNDKKPYTVSQTQHMKYKSPNRVYIQISQTGTGAAKASQGGQTTIIDGKSMIEYRPELKKYAKQPAPPRITVPEFLSRLQLTLDSSTAKMQTPTAWQGHAVYVISCYPPLPPDKTAAERQKAYATFKPREYWIDKQTFQLLHIAQKNAKGDSVTMDLFPQTFNSSIADSAFVFTPPAGVTEVIQSSRPNGAPGRPGGPMSAPPSGAKPPKK